MWRQVIYTRGASRGRGFAQHAPRNWQGGAIIISTRRPSRHPEGIRALSSAQPSSWQDSSPFTISPEPYLKQIPNPTAERVVMKTLLCTLQLNSVNVETNLEEDIQNQSTNSTTENTPLENTCREGLQQNELQVIQTEKSTALVSVSPVVSVPLESHEPDKQDRNEPKGKETAVARPRHVSHQRLLRAMNDKQLHEAKSAYRDCLANNQHIEKKHLLRLFDGVVSTDPIIALSILKEYKKMVGKPAPTRMYVKVCKSIGKIDWKIAKKDIFNTMCHDLREELVGLENEYYRRKCFPILLISLLQQPMPHIGRMARGLYAHMEQNDYALSFETMCDIIRVSKFSRQHDLSFPRVLARLVEQGHRPAPSVAIHVLQNLFPYTDMDETVLALKSIIQLQSSWEPGAPYPAYKVDVGILEHIMAAAARFGAFEVNILVWDLVDLLGYQPTECMYENTIHGFARVPQQDHNVFGVLSEMEERGFTPSRALIRSLSRSLCFSSGRVGNAYRILETSSDAEEQEAKVTLASLNAVLSAAAELPDVNRAFSIFEDFDAYGIEPNYDSYSYLLESLSKDLMSNHKGSNEKMTHAPERLDAAAAILSLMEEKGIPRCQHCVEHYAMLLYHAGRLDAATEFLLDSLERGDPVNNRVIIKMSKSNALAGNLEVARLMANRTSEPFAHLNRRIDDIEKKLKQEEYSDENESIQEE